MIFLACSDQARIERLTGFKNIRQPFLKIDTISKKFTPPVGKAFILC
jgi:hypothetical protein